MPLCKNITEMILIGSTFLADCTNSRAYATAFRPSSSVFDVMLPLCSWCYTKQGCSKRI